MKNISLPLMAGDNIQDVLDLCTTMEQKMTSNSEAYRYEITLNRHTKRICIRQHRQSGQGKNILHLYFEQTRRNCGDVLGFGQDKDYRDNSEYEGCFEHKLTNNDTNIIQLMIPEIKSDPCLTIPVTNGAQRLKRNYEGLQLMETNLDKYQSNSINQLTIILNRDDNPLKLTNGEHTIVLKYLYVPKTIANKQSSSIQPVQIQHDEEIQQNTQVQLNEQNNHKIITNKPINLKTKIQEWEQRSPQETYYMEQPVQSLQSQATSSKESLINNIQSCKKKLPLLDL
jgi:hypothetical protein